MTPRAPAGFVERIRLATLNSLHGLKFAFANEQAFRQELYVLAVAIPLGILIAPSFAWYCAANEMCSIPEFSSLAFTTNCTRFDVTPQWFRGATIAPMGAMLSVPFPADASSRRRSIHR